MRQRRAASAWAPQAAGRLIGPHLDPGHAASGQGLGHRLGQGGVGRPAPLSLGRGQGHGHGGGRIVVGLGQVADPLGSGEVMGLFQPVMAAQLKRQKGHRRRRQGPDQDQGEQPDRRSVDGAAQPPLRAPA
ncbi:hypothetical protein [Brevundimonas aurantiaca]|uniref:hypothetical protein n=1 Tax=Brevundimonas aurantiaca TaxID=74316 RepID=UPI001CD32F7B|nr:hypothetical protein [Brevundimonas aurantiaca]